MANIADFLLWAILPPLLFKDSETPAWLGLRCRFKILRFRWWRALQVNLKTRHVNLEGSEQLYNSWKKIYGVDRRPTTRY